MEKLEKLLNNKEVKENSVCSIEIIDWVLLSLEKIDLLMKLDVDKVIIEGNM